MRQAGFTLVEITIVLLIVALLLGGLLPTISGQVEQRRTSETIAQLEEIKEALIGYAIINGRLPCPASSISNGVESPAGTGNCTNNYDGFVPAATLGISGTDSSGYAIDAWGNRIRYAVTPWNSKTFTIPNGMSTAGISNLSPSSGALEVCSTAPSAPSNCNSNTSLTSNGVPALIFSTGKNGAQGFSGTDEQANLDINSTFVSHTATPTGAANGEFDDIVNWISPNTLINRMVTAGKLP